jgi:hypothetical protein
MIVEFFPRFPQAYPAKTYDAETAATALFKHYCTFGMFEEIVSDPGSALLSEAVCMLNKWLGVHQLVSLVGRHESNGCEGLIKQFSRHLNTLVADERIRDDWSSDRVLPLINWSLCSYPTTETGGFTPFNLKYGSLDEPYFMLPPDSHTDLGPFVAALTENLRILRERSKVFQDALIVERNCKDGPPQTYEPGDLVLFNPRERPSDHLPHKLHPRLLGPYQVVLQDRNDVAADHVVSHQRRVMHVTRLHPFVGSHEEAYRVAMLDDDQYVVSSINGYVGNPHLRTSVAFSVSFADGDTRFVRYTNDMASNTVLRAYIATTRALLPLRYTAALALIEMQARRKLPINHLPDNFYIDLHYFDGTRNAWYDSMSLPTPLLTHVVEVKLSSWSKNHRKCFVACPVFHNAVYDITAYDVDLYVWYHDELSPSTHVVITRVDEQRLPQLFE